MDTIKGKLERVSELIESGDALERDLALELLREIYSEVKFGGMPAAEVEVAVAANPATHIVDETALEGEDCQVAKEEPEPEVMQESEPESEPKIEPEPVQEPEPESEEEPEPPVIPRRVAPEVIRSLYGTEPDIEESTPAAAEQAEQKGHEPEPKHTIGDAATPKKTLGETLRNGERDMASHIAATQAAGRPGLKRSIGLNDRFLMIRDMFDGDADAFDRAITQLDAFTDLDEAVIWIHDNFDWSADSRGATLLVGLLERKLGR